MKVASASSIRSIKVYVRACALYAVVRKCVVYIERARNAELCEATHFPDDDHTRSETPSSFSIYTRGTGGWYAFCSVHSRACRRRRRRTSLCEHAWFCRSARCLHSRTVKICAYSMLQKACCCCCCCRCRWSVSAAYTTYTIQTIR